MKLLLPGILAFALCSCSVGTPPVLTRPEPTPRYVDLDHEIDTKLNAALTEVDLNKLLKHSVKDQVVTLSGKVPNAQQRKQAVEIAAAIPGVLRVKNELTD